MRRAACAYERVGDPRAVRDPKEARPANVADHVDEELCPSGVSPGSVANRASGWASAGPWFEPTPAILDPATVRSARSGTRSSTSWCA